MTKILKVMATMGVFTTKIRAFVIKMRTFTEAIGEKKACKYIRTVTLQIN